MIISLNEIFDAIIMTIVVGYIFMDTVTRRHHGLSQEYDPLRQRGFDWHGLWLSCLITSPAILVHEALHKTVAVIMGLQAEFSAYLPGLFLGAFLKFIGSPFVFFVPGFVATTGANTVQTLIIASAGPIANGAMYILGYMITEKKKSLKLSHYSGWMLFRKINGFLFVFNMLPIPGFDGFTVYYMIYKIAFG